MNPVDGKSKSFWHCEKCGEKIEGAFSQCWNCGSYKNGHEDPEFVSEVDVAELDRVSSCSFLEICLGLFFRVIAVLWRLLTMPADRRGPKRLIISIIFGLLINAGFVCCVAILVDYHMRVKPAVEIAIKASNEQGFDGPGVIFLIPGIMQGAYLTMAFWATIICTLLTWRYHSTWIRFVGLSPFLLPGLGRLVGW
ncbi:MAG: hypothetical protein JXM70_18680 [Pirellulales bacterium]|nr:hypothetical protein [Pirellulales bacterium]